MTTDMLTAAIVPVGRSTPIRFSMMAKMTIRGVAITNPTWASLISGLSCFQTSLLYG